MVGSSEKRQMINQFPKKGLKISSEVRGHQLLKSDRSRVVISTSLQRFIDRVSHNIVKNSAKNNWTEKKILNTAKNSRYLSKYGGSYCPAIGDTGVISVRYQMPVC
jgi:hypothetical protein